MKKTKQHVIYWVFSQQFLKFLLKVCRCVQLEEIDGRKVGVKTMRRKKNDLSCFLAPGAERTRGMLGKWVIRSCAGFSGCRLITQCAKNRWRHHRLSPSLSVGWRNVRACPVWPPPPSAQVLFESGSAVTLDLSERSAGAKLYPLANIDSKQQAWI